MSQPHKAHIVISVMLSVLMTTAILHANSQRTGRVDVRRGAVIPGRDGCTPEASYKISALSSVDTEHGTVGVLIDKPGCYALSNDLEVPSLVLAAILITAPEATLDLNQHTLLDEFRNARWLVRIMGPRRVVVRNGTLDGGIEGVYATADGIENSRVQLESLNIPLGRDSRYIGLISNGIALLHVRDSTVRGVDTAAILIGSGVIEDSVFRAASFGIYGEHFHRGRVLRNRIIGDRALTLGGRNFVDDNSVEARYGVEVLGSMNLIRGNSIQSGEMGVIVRNSNNRITGNMLSGRALAGITISQGNNNLISGNSIKDAYCGIQFDEAGSNLYRDNVIEGADEGVCGEPNRDGGGNTLPMSTCGNGIRGGDEVCDSKDLSQETCQTLGFFAGRLFCDESCAAFDLSRCHNCGNETVDQGEECDRSSLGGQSCASMGFDSGTIRCNDTSCEFDLSGCTSVCGDGIRRGLEECDGSDLGGASCREVGFDEGEIGCDASCDFNVEGCRHTCGNDYKSGGELCDGSDLGGATCESVGFDGGTLVCSVECDFDESGCSSVCGDGLRKGREECDGTDLGGASCEVLGFDGGALDCRDSCVLETSACTTCGNNIREGEEVCDGSDLGGESCQSQHKPPGILACNAACSGYNYAGCVGFLRGSDTRQKR